jgi:muramoyltetrapeptide carboxypeptidase
MKHVIPPYLKQGDYIGLTCPAGFLDPSKSKACIETLQRWGYEVMVGETMNSKSDNYFSGTDEERRNELQAMLDDPSIKAILFGRGGYGTGRIIDKLSFKKFLKHPKWLAGFSDITVMHNHLLSNYHVASIHASMAAEFDKDPLNNPNIISLKNALEGKSAGYKIENHPLNIKGEGSGILVGGNLALLSHIIGTDSDFETKNRILFIEDIGEYLYNVDRMLNQLQRAGKLKRLAGLIFGGFTDLKDTTRPFGKTIEAILLSYTGYLKCPVCFDFPVGHGEKNFALKTGVKYQLLVNNKQTVLKELD